MTDRVIGQYRITGVLGRGGMGKVYAAEHTLLGRPAAVKVLLPELSRRQEIVQRFFNEARAATAIRHPGIVEIYDFGWTDDGAAFIVMERLEGETLRARRKRGTMSLGAALVITRQMAGALGAAHAKGIVHRDLKPDNVFLVLDPEVPGGERIKLLDFGIAKLASSTTGGQQQNMTRTGAVIGTPTYMAPEQCRGVAVDSRADLYALGCILFELCAGRPPFVGEGEGDVLGAHIYVAPPALSSLAPGVPKEVEALVAHLLAKAPGDRVQAAEEVIRRIDAASTSLSGPRTAFPHEGSAMAAAMLVQAFPHEPNAQAQAQAQAQAMNPRAFPHEPSAQAQAMNPRAFPHEPSAQAQVVNPRAFPHEGSGQVPLPPLPGGSPAPVAPSPANPVASPARPAPSPTPAASSPAPVAPAMATTGVFTGGTVYSDTTLSSAVSSHRLPSRHGRRKRAVVFGLAGGAIGLATIAAIAIIGSTGDEPPATTESVSYNTISTGSAEEPPPVPVPVAPGSGAAPTAATTTPPPTPSLPTVEPTLPKVEPPAPEPSTSPSTATTSPAAAAPPVTEVAPSKEAAPSKQAALPKKDSRTASSPPTPKPAQSPVAKPRIEPSDLLTPTRVEVTIDSSPPGAELLREGISAGKTPFRGMLRMERDIKLTVRLRGYRDQVITVRPNAANKHLVKLVPMAHDKGVNPFD